MQQGDKNKSVFNGDVDVDGGNANRDSRTDDGRDQGQQQEVTIDNSSRQRISGVEATGYARCHYRPHINADCVLS
jgi:hypothetical protein